MSDSERPKCSGGQRPPERHPLNVDGPLRLKGPLIVTLIGVTVLHRDDDRLTRPMPSGSILGT